MLQRYITAIETAITLFGQYLRHIFANFFKESDTIQLEYAYLSDFQKRKINK